MDIFVLSFVIIIFSKRIRSCLNLRYLRRFKHECLSFFLNGNLPSDVDNFVNYHEVGIYHKAYHVCHDGREGHQGASFLCTNGTIFNQHEFTCDWWYNVNCADAPTLYNLNLDPTKNPFIPKPKKEEAPEKLRIAVY